MSITPDQTAVLELLLGGQSYGDLSDLLGLDESQVRDRARSGLEAIGGADPDANVALSDYLLGQADPIGRADAVRHLRQDDADHALAAGILAGLAKISPEAALPTLPGAPARRAPTPGSPKGRTLPAKVPSLGGLGNRARYLLGGGSVALVVVVLAVAGVFSGDDDPAADSSSTDANGSLRSDDAQQLERVELTAVGNGDATGQGIVGLTTGDQPYIDIVLENLEPAPDGQVYVVWFLFDEKRGYPLSPIGPDNKGAFADRFAIPQPAIPVVQRMRYLNVSLAPIEAVQKSIQDAVDAQELVIKKPGRTVLQNSEPLQAAPAADGQGGSAGG